MSTVAGDGRRVRVLEWALVIFAVLFSVVLGGRASGDQLASVDVGHRSYHTEIVPQEPPAAICHPAIPQADCQAAVFVYEFVLTHNWTPPKGYVGGKKFVDKGGALPPGGDYKEYDIYPKPEPGSSGRDAKRIVIDARSQAMFYTADHYASFVKLTYSY